MSDSRPTSSTSAPWQRGPTVVGAAASSFTRRSLRAASKHPRSIMGSVMVALGTFAVAAFGIAPMAPDAAALPKMTVVERISFDTLTAQRDALATHQTPWHRSTETRSSDTMASLLDRLGITDITAAQFARNDPAMRRLLEGRTGKKVQGRVDSEGRLLSLTARLPSTDSALSATHFTRLTVKQGATGLESTLEPVPLAASVRIGSGTIRSSLFEATDAARVPDAVAIQIAEIFASEIDFHRELRKGDSFRVVYETLLADDEPVTWNGGSGRVLAAEFTNKGEQHSAVWFQSSAKPGDPVRGEYYDFDGQSRRRAFLASPLEFSRVTSGFSMRFHPVLKSWRKHLGTDYAAPTGTAARTVGDGVVDFAGRQGGYGNVVIVKHSQQRTTVYAHLSRIDVRVGQAVQQGQTIGAVGSTGWSTGPHLHFEFRVGGEHKDPLMIAKASETIPIPAHAKAAFKTQAADYAQRLQVAQTLESARGRVE